MYVNLIVTLRSREETQKSPRCAGKAHLLAASIDNPRFERFSFDVDFLLLFFVSFIYVSARARVKCASPMCMTYVARSSLLFVSHHITLIRRDLWTTYTLMQLMQFSMILFRHRCTFFFSYWFICRNIFASEISYFENLKLKVPRFKNF